MSNEVISDVFSSPVTLRLGTPLVTGHLTMSVIGNNGNAWSQVFTYDPSARVMDIDGEKLGGVIDSHISTSNVILGVLIAVSDIVVNCINFVAGIIRGILGSFIGFGLMGILIVLIMLALSLLVSAYAFVIAAPVLILSYGLRYYKDSQLKDEAAKLQKAALDLFERVSTSPLAA